MKPNSTFALPATLAILVVAASGTTQANPTAIDGTPFILVATNSSAIQLFGLAIDAQGRVYAGNNSNDQPGIPVQLFDPSLFTGTPLSFQSLGPVCQDGDGINYGNGFIFIADASSGVRKVAVSNGASSVFIPGAAENPTGSPLVYRPVDGHLFVGLGGLTGIDEIDEYDAAGAFLTNHATRTDVETMTFDPQSGLIYYAPYGPTVRSLNPNTGADQLVGTVDGTIDGALTLDPLSQLLFVGMANGTNPGFIETIDVNNGSAAPFASGFSDAVGISRDTLSGNLYFLDDHNLYVLDKTNVNESIPPIAINIVWSNFVSTTTWKVVAGNSYQLQHASQLVNPIWTNITAAFTASSNLLNLVDSSATNIEGFYRAVLVH